MNNLVIFDEPKELYDFYKKMEFLWGDTGYCYKGIEKAPKSWQYAYVEDEV